METGIAHKSTLNASASRQLHMYLETDMMVGRTSTKQDAFQLSHEPRGLSDLVAGGHQIARLALNLWNLVPCATLRLWVLTVFVLLTDGARNVVLLRVDRANA